jgi:alpha-pyrone synthase
VITSELVEKIPKGTLAIIDTHAYLMEGTEDGIMLSINDDGISCKLSKLLPQYIAKNMGGFVDGFLEKHNYSRSDVNFWAIHPGGRRIIEEAQNGLGIHIILNL